MSIWAQEPRPSEDDRLVDKFTRKPKPAMSGRDVPRFVSCVCGWGTHTATLRAATDAFYVHQLLGSVNSEHAVHIEDAVKPGPSTFDP